MPHSGTNPRLEILINGKSAHIIGMEDFGVLSVVVDWIRRDPATKPNDSTAAEWERNAVDLHTGGLDSRRNQHVSWHDCQLKVGDEVTVRVLPPGDYDQPKDNSFDPQTGTYS
jgi:hypothetical protein